MWLQDWDILYLNSIFTNKGAQVSPHLVAVRWTPSAIGYIPTPAFARKVLANARSRGYSTWIDVIFEVRVVGGLCIMEWVGPAHCCVLPLGTLQQAHMCHLTGGACWWRLAKTSRRKCCCTANMCVPVVLLQQMERHCEAQAYLVQPPLVQYAQLGTTAAYSVTDMNYTWWERIWYLNKVARRLQQV